MKQEKIWDYFQNIGIDSFNQAIPRYRYIANRIGNASDFSSVVLNIGVGNGALEQELLAKGLNVSSIDPNAEAIERLKALGVDARVGFVQELPYKDCTFDYVVASEVLEHLNELDFPAAISEIKRVLKNNGILIGTVPFNEKLDDNFTVCPHCGERFHRWGHQQSFDKDKINKIIGQHLEMLTISCRTFVSWKGGIMRFIKSAAKMVLARMGEAIADPHIYFEYRK